MKAKGWHLISTKLVAEEDGQLWVTEGNNEVPFEIKRIFCVMHVAKGISRGNHANKKTNLILFPICGSCDVVVDDGTRKETFHLDDPTTGLYIDNMIWRCMINFTPDCILMAVCDRPYDPDNETYDDYEEYLRALRREEDAPLG